MRPMVIKPSMWERLNRAAGSRGLPAEVVLYHDDNDLHGQLISHSVV